jgi:tetratricopeptide (TPR) repeat protein
MCAPRMARLFILGMALIFAAPAMAQVEPEPPMADPPAVQAPELPQPQPDAMQPTDEELLLKPEKIDPEQSRSEVLADLFERLRQAPDDESAEAVAETIQKIWLRSGSDTIDVLMNRVAQSVQEENLDMALDILDSVVAIKPDYAEGWNQRATVFFMQRDFRRSLDDLQHVLALEPRHFKAINGLALIMQELGDKKAALKAFREALELYPQSEDMKRVEEELAREVEGQGI